MSTCAALIVAAGRGSRFGGKLPKQYCRLGRQTVIELTLKAFAGHPQINSIRVVIHADDLDLYQETVANLSRSGVQINLLEPVFGGDSRQQSVCRGLESLTQAAPDLVLIHDAARPFVSTQVIDRVLAALVDHGAVIPGLAVNDTLKHSQDNFTAGTIDRSRLVRAQTPQGFHFEAILAAHRSAPAEAMSDDAAIAEFAGLAVNIVPGGAENIKITSQDDLQLAERTHFLHDNKTFQSHETRIGSGFDVHRFGPGDGVTLCGVRLPHPASLAGHSDADVALHALTDALLGAIGEGDIGDHFPPTDPRWKDVSSDVFVTSACQIIAGLGGRIVNVDITLICESPKISPFRAAMTETLARLLDITPDRVGIKATTTEKLGFTGRNEGIAAQAVAAIEMPKG
ncbi:MAG TPA: bifunctional 2-C-methyl-D-erythritol 4-phosphate cytidylyltransferase/2-C-methyl-D-erythritol 2,4-cyclodiphosphate synthase [Rhodospirillales bacterium]|nr:bifunctional 2-C-methyl-D-erythritol 4-phosphate cytidylyltransferase/2-C-methyl-D-erythritol 2,4-cyclodiphosphate synthase [Rhodospirillales bacterium]